MHIKNPPDKEKEFESMVEANRPILTKVCYMYARDPDHFKDL